jgi:hypothetical protein
LAGAGAVPLAFLLPHQVCKAHGLALLGWLYGRSSRDIDIIITVVVVVVVIIIVTGSGSHSCSSGGGVVLVALLVLHEHEPLACPGLVLVDADGLLNERLLRAGVAPAHASSLILVVLIL